MLSGVAVIVLPMLVTLVAYHHTANFEFTLDDRSSLQNNPDVVDPSAAMLDLISHDFWGMPLSSKSSHQSYRPLTVLSFRLDRWRAGALPAANGFLPHSAAATFHVTNIWLHAAASSAVAALAWQLGGCGGGGAAALTGMLFASHPIHTESVANVTGRADVLALLLLCGFLSITLAEARRVVPSDGHSAKWYATLALSVLLAVATGLCKETAMPCLLLPVVWHIWTAGFGGILSGRLRAHPLLASVLPIALLFMIRTAVGGGQHASLVRFEFADAPLLVEAALTADTTVTFTASPAEAVNPVDESNTRAISLAKLAQLPFAPFLPHASEDQEMSKQSVRLGPSSRRVSHLASSVDLISSYLWGMFWDPWPAAVLLSDAKRGGRWLHSAKSLPKQWPRAYAWDRSLPAWVPVRPADLSMVEILHHLLYTRMIWLWLLLTMGLIVAWRSYGTGAATHDDSAAVSDSAPSNRVLRSRHEPSTIRLVWFLLLGAGLILPSQLLLPLGVTYADRLAYIPSAGACALASSLLFEITTPITASAVGLAAVAGMTVSTIAHSEDWHTNDHLYLSALQGPGRKSVKVQLNAAVTLAARAEQLENAGASQHDVCLLKQRAARLFVSSASAGPDYPLGFLNAAKLESGCGWGASGASSLAAGLKTDCLSGWSAHRHQTCVRELTMIAQIAAELLAQAALRAEPDSVRAVEFLLPHVARAHALLCLTRNEATNKGRVKSRLLQPGSFVPHWGQQVNHVEEACLVRGDGCPVWSYSLQQVHLDQPTQHTTNNQAATRVPPSPPPTRASKLKATSASKVKAASASKLKAAGASKLKATSASKLKAASATTDWLQTAEVRQDAQYFKNLAQRVQRPKSNQKPALIALLHAHALTTHCKNDRTCDLIHVEAIIKLGELNLHGGDICCAAHLAGTFLDSSSALQGENTEWHVHVRTQKQKCIEEDNLLGNVQRKCFRMHFDHLISNGVRHAVRGASVHELIEFNKQPGEENSCGFAIDAASAPRTPLPLVCAYGAAICDCAPLLRSLGPAPAHFQDLQLEPVAAVAVLGAALESPVAAIEMFHSLSPLEGAQTYLCVFRRHLEGSHGTARLFGVQLEPELLPSAKLPELTSADGLFGLVATSSPTLIGLGEDPRLIWHVDRFYVYLQEMTGSPAQVRIYLHDLKAGERIMLEPPELTPSSLAPHGKNWAPFSYKGALYFVYCFEPLSVMRCDDLESNQSKCEWVRSPDHDLSQFPVGVFRGGSPGVVLPNEDAQGGGATVIGAGHVTLTDFTHTMFVWRLEMPSLRIRVSVVTPQQSISPLPGYTICDPTSMFVTNGSWHVALTLRRYPDFATFEQRHMTTRIFKLETELLDDLIDRTCNCGTGKSVSMVDCGPRSEMNHDDRICESYK